MFDIYESFWTFSFLSDWKDSKDAPHDGSLKRKQEHEQLGWLSVILAETRVRWVVRSLKLETDHDADCA